MNIGDKILLNYSKGKTTAVIDSINNNELHITSPALGGMTIQKSRVRKLKDNKRADFQYFSIN